MEIVKKETLNLNRLFLKRQKLGVAQLFSYFCFSPLHICFIVEECQGGTGYLVHEKML